MAAAQYDLVIEIGATYTDAITWQGSDGNPVDLTGYTARMQIRATADATTVILELTSGSGITLGGAAGTIARTIPAATTSTYSPGRLGVYDLIVTAPDGTVTRILEGAVTAHAGVTR